MFDIKQTGCDFVVCNVYEWPNRVATCPLKSDAEFIHWCLEHRSALEKCQFGEAKLAVRPREDNDGA